MAGRLEWKTGARLAGIAGGMQAVTTLRPGGIASLAVLALLLAGCGPSQAERDARMAEIAARARADAPKVPVAAPSPEQTSEAADDSDEEDEEAGEMGAPMDDAAGVDPAGNNDGAVDSAENAYSPPPPPFAQPPAMIDVPQPDPEPAGPGNVEYVQVRG